MPKIGKNVKVPSCIFAQRSLLSISTTCTHKILPIILQPNLKSEPYLGLTRRPTNYILELGGWEGAPLPRPAGHTRTARLSLARPRAMDWMNSFAGAVVKEFGH